MSTLERGQSAADEKRVDMAGGAQLTFRALALGSAIGAVACVSNLYVGLKNMVAVSVGVTACLVCYSLQRVLVRVSPNLFGPRMSILEINIAQTTASSIGYSTGGAMISAIAAHLLATGHHLPFPTLLVWTFLLSALGVLFALPVKRSMIDIEQLPFPTGTATAMTLQSLYARGTEADKSSRVLGLAGLTGALIALWRDGLSTLRGFAWTLPASLPIPGALRGVPLQNLSFSVDVGVLGLGVGALIGLRTTFWMVAGSVFCFGVLGPRLFLRGDISEMNYSSILNWGLWPGAALLASASVVVLLFHAGVAWRGLTGASRRSAHPASGGTTFVEIPKRWYAVIVAVLCGAAMAVGRQHFGIPPLFTAAGIALSWMLAIIACRATGETDVTPTGALGLVTQLGYGALLPRDVPANLVGASVTGNTGATAADFLSNLKAGYLLGASPRRQLAAQLFGTALGSIIIVSFFWVLVPDSSALGTERFPAPGAAMALGVARLCASGLQAVPPAMRWGLLVATLVGLGLGTAEALAPERAKRWVPSPIGLGLSFLLPASMSLALFIGALASAVFERLQPEAAKRYTVPISSGLIAGESVVAVLLAIWAATAIAR